MHASGGNESPSTDPRDASRIPVSDLLLNPDNPRLPTFKEIPNQETLVAWVVKEQSVDELMDSISRDGYLENEPLVGIPSATARRKVVILEGNRRLAALRLLLDAKLASSLTDPETGQPIPVKAPATTAITRLNLNQVPVRLYTDQSGAMAYLRLGISMP